MEKEIIKLLGKPGNTVVLIDVNDYDKVYGLYHWDGEVCCLKGGCDIVFTDLDEDEQQDVYNHMVNGRFKVDNTLQ